MKGSEAQFIINLWLGVAFNVYYVRSKCWRECSKPSGEAVASTKVAFYIKLRYAITNRLVDWASQLIGLDRQKLQGKKD